MLLLPASATAAAIRNSLEAAAVRATQACRHLINDRLALRLPPAPRLLRPTLSADPHVQLRLPRRRISRRPRGGGGGGDVGAAVTRRRRRSSPARRSRSRSNGRSAPIPALRLPYQDNISALLHEPSFRRAAGEAVFAKAKIHQHAAATAPCTSEQTIAPATRRGAVQGAVPRLLLAGAHLCAQSASPPTASPSIRGAAAAATTSLQAGLRRSCRRSRPSWTRRDGELDEAARRQGSTSTTELQALRAEVADARKAANAASRTRTTTPRPRPATLHRPAAARGRLAARQAATTASSRSRACRTTQGNGFVDYVLWGDDGKPLGAGRGQAHAQGRRAWASSRPSSTPTAWSAVRPAAGDLLHQRLRALDLGRHALPAARRCRASTRRTSWSC